MAQTTEKHPFRTGTKNLILSGLEEHLRKAEVVYGKHPFMVRRISGVFDYSGIPSPEPSQGVSEVYLAQTRDVRGHDLDKLTESDARRYFEPFDSVLIL